MCRTRFVCFATALLLLGTLTEAGAARNAPPTVPEVSRDNVICFALYTVNNSILKLTAQLYPLEEGEERTVRLEIKKDGKWVEIARTNVIERGWTAPFRIENWDSARDYEYRVAHGTSAYYTGVIRRDPVDKETIVVAAFTGNSNKNRGPRPDIVKNIKAQDPDLLFFSGDQSYDHRYHYAAWLLFGRQFGEIIRDRPTICIPDDHDVGQGNLWGAGGKKSRSAAGSDGGYFMPVEYVNEVQRAQTSHLPDPYDPTPIERGIGVYYTSMTLGGISFAIIEDRKFKSGPEQVLPPKEGRPDHITDPDYDPKSVDVPGAVLLGERQLSFLRDWATDWRGADMKVVLSQTVFAGAAHLHGGATGNQRLVADLDCNGWPQTARNNALKEIRKAFALMIGGDQHLGTVIHHGVDDWNDSGFSLCVPSIDNFYGRSWAPLVPGRNRREGPLEHTGEYKDGLGNKITMYAYANPTRDNYQAAGYGLVRLNRRTRKISIECWPRFVDVTSPDAEQFPGWPVTIDQADNYGRKAAAYLPTVEVSGMNDPVAQVIDESNGEIVYTLRIKGKAYRPKVFKPGKYTVKIGEQDGRMKTFEGVESMPPEEHRRLQVEF